MIDICHFSQFSTVSTHSDIIPLLVTHSCINRQGVLDTTLCDKVSQWLEAGQWFSPGTPISSTDKTDRHDITEISLKLTLSPITLTPFGRAVFSEIKGSTPYYHNHSFL